MNITIAALTEWLALGEKVIKAGAGAMAAVKAAAASQGVEQDTAQLDAVILDAERRKALAEAEAAGTPVPPTV
jgi:hypothetical protein